MTKIPKMTKRAEEAVIAQALGILYTRMTKSKDLLNSGTLTEDYLRLKLGMEERELFGILFVDNSNRLIKDEVMFRGTLNHTQVYPREVVKTALACNAAGIILYHNHPNGDVTPSPQDIGLTGTLKGLLTYVDVRLIDHVIIAGPNTFSFLAGELLK